MNIVQRHLQIDERWGTLPAATTAASFNFFDQCIVFANVKERDVRDIYKEKTTLRIFDKISEIYLTAFHEYRHWLDLTSSTYGLNWLNSLISICELADLEINCNAFKKTCREVSQLAAEIRLPSYYSVLESLHDERPWQYGITVGQAFNTEGVSSQRHPIWFLRFEDARKRSIARQPISMASLLETRAVEAELSASARILFQIKTLPEKDKENFKSALERDIINRVYTPQLTLYSAAAHWYANNRSNPDIAEAYLSASRLAEFCLNAPSEWIGTLAPTRQFDDGMGEDGARLMRNSLARQDRAALFFMMAYDKRLTSYERFDIQLDEILREWGTDALELQKAAVLERQDLLQRLGKKSPKAIEIFLNSVEFNQRNKSYNAEVQIFSELKLPAILLYGDVPFNIFTFKTGSAAFTGKIFDPSLHACVFGNIEDILYSNRKYTEYLDHCFAKV